MQAGHLRLLHLDLLDILFLPQMANLKHVIISTRGGGLGRFNFTDTSASMFACLQHLTAVETLDLKVIASEGDVQVRTQFATPSSECAQPNAACPRTQIEHRPLTATIVGS